MNEKGLRIFRSPFFSSLFSRDNLDAPNNLVKIEKAP